MKRYLSVFIILVFMLTSSSIFSKEEIDISKSKNFISSSETNLWFFENLAHSVLIDGKDFAKGKDFKLKYNFEDPIYKKILEEYKIKEIAKQGSSFEKMVRVMDNFSHRLVHSGNFSAKIKDIKEFKGKTWETLTSYDVLKYSLDNKDHGINCAAKTEILNAMGAALGIYTRTVWMGPYEVNVGSPSENHVMTEIWDENLNKWIMLDMTSNLYWVDSNKTPLSTVEIRDRFISKDKGLKAVFGEYKMKKLKSEYKNKKEYEIELEASQYNKKLYYLKNLYVIAYDYKYWLVPNNSSFKNKEYWDKKVSDYLISRKAVEVSPVEK